MVVGMQVAQPSAADTAAVLVAWSNAWLTGHLGLDEAADAIERISGPHVVLTGPDGGAADGSAAGPGAARPDPGALPHPGVRPEPGVLPGRANPPKEVPLRHALADLRMAGMTALRLALPVPGDPLGLTGPPPLNAAAIEAGEAALASLPDRTIGLVPSEDLRGSSYRGVRWNAFEARHGFADVPSLPEADRQLSMAVREATDALMTVDDVSSRQPEILNALAELRESGDISGANGLAPGYPGRAHRVAALAGRLSVVVDLARSLEAGMLTADQIRRRSDALRLLDRAVRRARVAACNSVFDPVP